MHGQELGVCALLLRETASQRANGRGEGGRRVWSCYSTLIPLFLFKVLAAVIMAGCVITMYFSVFIYPPEVSSSHSRAMKIHS